jgi:AcrR family transcriptional regulator
MADSEYKRNNKCDKVPRVNDNARETSGGRVGEQRPGGRAARVRAAVLAATEDLLMEVGYDELTVDEVARRAGVHKTTVYRRWPTKPGLVADAVREQSAEAVPIPDTGSLLGDLRQLARDVAGNVSSEGPGRRTRTIVAAAASSSELATHVNAFWSHRLERCSRIVQRAVERGELASAVDPDLVIEALVGPIWLRLLVTGEPIDDHLIDRLAELVDAGARAASSSAARA